MVSIDDDDRGRGVLTPADRKFLRGESDLTEDSAINVRDRIRKRIRHALADFQLLTDNLTERDRRLLFKDTGHRTREEFLSDGVVAKSSNRGTGMLENVVIFVYIVCKDWGVDFEALVERAVKKAETSVWFDGRFERQENVSDMDVSVELRRDSAIDVERAMERFEADEYLSNAEIGALVRAGKIDSDELL